MPQIINMIIIVDFNINQDYIAEVLCINKDKPEMKCNGKCHLKKELKKTEDPVENPKTEFVQLRNEILYYQHPQKTIRDIILAEPKSKFITTNSDCYKSDYVSNIFHPPKIII